MDHVWVFLSLLPEKHPKLILSTRNPQSQSRLMNLPNEILNMIWRAVQEPLRYYVYYEGTRYQKGGTVTPGQEHIKCIQPPAKSKAGLFLACRRTLHEASEAAPPLCIQVNTPYLNSLLHLLQTIETEPGFKVGGLLIHLYGQPTSRSSKIDIETIRTRLAMDMLELKRCFTEVTFLDVSYANVLIKCEYTPRCFDMYYEVDVGKPRATPLWGPIAHRHQHPATSLEAEGRELGSRINWDALKRLLNSKVARRWHKDWGYMRR
jgi:hypothetical protein